MRAVQGAASTLQGAYLAYVTKRRGAATKRYAVKTQRYEQDKKNAALLQGAY